MGEEVAEPERRALAAPGLITGSSRSKFAGLRNLPNEQQDVSEWAPITKAENVLVSTRSIVPRGIVQAMDQEYIFTDARHKRSRMVEAVIWSTPSAATRYFRNNCFLNAESGWNDAIYMSRSMEPDMERLTPNVRMR